MTDGASVEDDLAPGAAEGNEDGPKSGLASRVALEMHLEEVKNEANEEMSRGKQSGSLEHYKLAEGLYREAIELIDDNISTDLKTLRTSRDLKELEDLKGAKVTLHANLAAALLEQDRFDDAEKECLAALAIDPAHEKSKHRLQRTKDREDAVMYQHRIQVESAERDDESQREQEEEEQRDKEQAAGREKIWEKEAADMDSDHGLSRTSTVRHRSFYQVLELRQDSELAEVKKQYRRLCVS
jgi:tetratricopeptide (TPR) repeat protein